MNESLRDRQIRMTRELIGASLLELMREKPREKIRISDICRRAGVSRGTFYNHYADMDELMDSVISWYADFLSSHVGAFFESETLSRERQNEILRGLLDALIEQKDYCRLILCGSAGSEALQKAQEQILERYGHWLTKYRPGIDREKAMYALTASLSGGLAVLRRWMQNDFRESTDELLVYIQSLRTILSVH